VLLPIGDAPNAGRVPIVTYLLIAANVAVYLLVTAPLSGVAPAPGDPAIAAYLRAISHTLGPQVATPAFARQVSAYDLYLFTHGFRPVAPSVGGLFASMFLHADIVHLGGNMLFLWIYGDNVERRLGRVRYLATYLATGVAAVGLHWLGARDSELPIVGASGAISGVLGCYFIWFPRNVVRLLWLMPPFIGDVVEVRARVVLGFYLIADNLLPYVLARGAGGVAHGAHIGGFVAGVAIAWLSRRPPEPAYPAYRDLGSEL
jgi:membrane associated rhomboid family serine protease